MELAAFVQRSMCLVLACGLSTAACNDSPPPSTPATRAAETESSPLRPPASTRVAKPAPADESGGSASAPTQEPAAKSSPPQGMRYGPKAYALPAGCGPAGEKFSCNPLTNAGCRAEDGEVCDDDDHEAFGCDPDSDNVKEGGDCNDKDGPSCAAGMTCDTPSASEPRGICRKFCCTKADCAAPAKCAVLDREFGSLGVCK